MCMRRWEGSFAEVIQSGQRCDECNPPFLTEMIFDGEDDKGLTWTGKLNTHGKWQGVIDSKGDGHAVLTRTIQARDLRG